MSKVFTLESMKEEIEREFAPVVFEAEGQKFVLKSLLRVDKKVRDEVMEKLQALDKKKDDEFDEDEVFDTVRFLIKAVTDERKGAALVRLVGDDILLAMKLLEKWTEATQPGEAQDSPS
jgi:hypothetical protein